MAWEKALVIALFVLTYAMIIRFYSKKSRIVWSAVAILMVMGVISPMKAWEAINWNVILLYFGMLFVSEVFLFSKMPDFLASYFASKTKSTTMAMMVICMFASFLSIFLENVAVVLLVAPIAISISQKCKINPVPLFIGMAVCSNLQGTATLIGDPPSMLLGSYANMSFNDFFFLDGKPSIFFAVQVGALFSFMVLYHFFRKQNHAMPPLSTGRFVSALPALLVIGLVVSLIATSTVEFPIMAGILCILFGALSYLWYTIHSKNWNIVRYVQNLDWQTGLFLMGIFILVESLTVTGVISDIASGIQAVAGTSILSTFVVLTVLSVALSAFIDNVPYLVVMLPVVVSLTQGLGVSPYAFYFALLIGASVGGNITPIGASANIVAMGIAKKHGYKSSFMDFVRIGLPFTLVAVAGSTAFVWFVFS